MFISNKRLNNELKEAEKRGSSKQSTQIKTLTTDKKILEENLTNAKAELEALKSSRVAARKIKKLELELEIKSDDLEAKSSLVDAKQKRLDNRIKDLEKEEADQYKKGYADGVADGLRKVTELTEQDRNNMTKIAMVSAARGTDAAQIQGVTDVLQLTSSNSDKQVK